METPCWLLVLDDVAARDLARSDWHRLALARSIDGGPAEGSRVAIVRTHRPDFLTRAVVLGTADVRGVTADALELRHRVVAPSGHEPALAALHLRIGAGWTQERLGALIGTAIPLPPADEERTERALRAQALAFGPAPSRPAHHAPRTPGRRALASARIAARKLSRSRVTRSRQTR